MSTLTITAKGQVTLRKGILAHIGVEPGDKVEVTMLPGGTIALQAVRPTKSWDQLSGLLANKTTKVATLEELTEAAQRGWAGLLDDHD